MTGEDSAVQQGVSKRMSLAIGARRHLECGHEKHIMDTIQSHPTQVLISILYLFCVYMLLMHVKFVWMHLFNNFKYAF